ncbi:MAG: ribonuclease J [Fimbriimonadaceae bacterium]
MKTPVQVIPLGGVGEIGKNCTAIRQDDDIVVIDVGLSFPDDEMPGVDIIVPDFSYLIENRDKIRGIFLTHAHEDHVGGLPYLVEHIEAPIYTSEFTHALIAQKLEEKCDARHIKKIVLKTGEIVQCGSLSVEPVRITHSIPETFAMAIRTRHGIILMTSDFKFDFTPVDHKLSNIARLGELGEEGVLALLSDSTNVERPGWGPSEREVSHGLRKVFTEAEGRVLLTTFASSIHRMQQVYDVAAETGRKVAVVGRRMESNVDICSRMGYLKIPKNTRIMLDEIKMHEPHELAILTTGSQGEPMSALVQMSKQEYGRLKLQSGDTLIYSARPIPGNESGVWKTINRLFKMGVNVVYSSNIDVPVHVSGHAYQEELKMMINITKPFYVAPVHGEPRHQHQYLEMARDMGYPEHRAFTFENGLPLCFDETNAWFGDPIQSGAIMVDSSGHHGVTQDVLKERLQLSQSGVVTVALPVTGRMKLTSAPKVSARGFLGDEVDLESVADLIADYLGSEPNRIENDANLISETEGLVRRHLQKRTGARPVVLVSVVR